MEVRVWTLILLIAVFPVLAVAQTSSTDCGLFTVRPESDALVLDKSGNVKRVVGPGLHICVPMVETVWIENTLFERREDVEIWWPEDQCEITVSVFWNISDLEVYYTKGQEAVAVSVIEKQVQEAHENAEVSSFSRETISNYLQITLRENRGAFEEYGVNFLRSFASLEDCIQE
ncbi:hypothetical protein EF888_18705 [Silicimonas algicola]|nr:hypothetical protein [Silicimonas algicola]AZQ68982.1 hypothetical protein EF888_18705 [Silicimonas algicola]